MSFRRLLAASLLAAATLAAAGAPALAQTKLKMVLNWKFQGPQGWFFLAQDRGYFAREGLDVTIDQGNGSSAPIPLLATGAYDVGFGDINALVEFASQRPDEAAVAVYMIYNRPPFTIAVKSGSPIRVPKDLEGKTLGGAPNDGALKLFPAFCKLANIDCRDVKITNMQPNLREQVLMQGQIEGAFGFVNTIRFSAKLTGIDPDKELRWINYGDYGLDLYSNAILVSRPLVQKNPQAVRGLVKAINQGIVDALKSPDEAVAAVAKRDRLIDLKIERERFDATVKDEMNHPEIASIGLGDIDAARMKRAIEILAESSGLARVPTVEQVFDRSFLPAKAERPTKLF
jgi:NitT/TauT family transport system substrate-binding protein